MAIRIDKEKFTFVPIKTFLGSTFNNLNILEKLNNVFF